LDHTVAADLGERRGIDHAGTPLGTGRTWPGGDHHLRGIPSTGEQGTDLVPDEPLGDALAHGVDGAAHLEAGDVVTRRGVGR
jgi:hypothetical protein